EKSKKFYITIGDYANVGNHLHLKVRCKYRWQLQNFLRSITTVVARHVTGAKRGHKVGRFWQGLAFTRVLTSSIEELRLSGYFKANRIEAQKGHQARQAFLKMFNRWVYQLTHSRAGP